MINFLIQTINSDGKIGFVHAFAIGYGGVIAMAVITVAIVLAFYVLRSIGLYVLAKRQNVNCPFIAFIPIAWMYTVCKIIGNVKIFNFTFARVALIFAIIFGVSEIMSVVYNALVYYPLVGNLLIGGKEIYIVDDVLEFLKNNHGYSEYWAGEGIVINNSTFIWPYSPATESIIAKVCNIMSYASLVFDIASIIIIINVYLALFRKFWPQHFILATVCSFFGFFAPFVFAIRRKNAIKYSDYMRARYNMYYGNPYGTPYGTPYGNPYKYQGAPNEQRPSQPEHPFKEFAERGEVDPGDPFEEFSTKSEQKSTDEPKDKE